MAWNPFGVSLEISATAGTVTRTSATQFTVKINASWETYYNGAETTYGMDVSSGGKTVTLNKFTGAYHSSGSGTLTGTYSISGNAGATKTITVTFKNYNTDNGNSATKNISLSVSVPAWTSYTVKYNANGGSGAPSSQTKWKDQTLTLSSTKPTRTGYSFQGWATSASGSVAYAAGAKYTANAGVTLYAVWKANTYTVSYNANGGSGAPSSQTKTYGVTLTLSSTKPTRTNYTFKGWGTSASATTVSYAAGASYTANAAITLYAIWELAYVKPRITKFSVTRCNSAGTAQIDGTYALVKFSWSTDKTIDRLLIEWKLATASSYASYTTASGSGTSGTVNLVVGSGGFATNLSYNIRVTVKDTVDSTVTTATLSSMTFSIHAKPGGTGIAFGKMQEGSNCAEFGWDIELNGNDILRNGTPAYAPFTKLTDIGITTFPTTMQTVVNAMPNHSMLMLDSRDIIAGGTHEISDLGIADAGMYMIMRGNSNARISLLNIYGATSATISYMNYGCYAPTNDEVVWIRGERPNSTDPDCRYRYSSAGVYEWINPPMIAGAEYRTIEKYQGKYVYAKLVNFGALPNATTKTVGYRDDGCTNVVSITAILDNGCVIHGGTGKDLNMGKSYNITLNCTKYNIRILTDYDFSSRSAYVLVKYTLD